jgi:ornithine decarboxylase
MLNNQNSSFEVASLGELRACIAAGVSANDIHFGNTIKTVENIKIAYALGVKSYAIDCEQELFKVAHNAPESSVICRITTDGVGATWGLCNKFGTSVEQTAELLLKAKKLGANKIGVSFHVGSQQKSPDAWRRALLDVKIVYDILAKNNVSLDIINLGGGFPAPGYLNTSDEQVNYSFQEYGCAINDYIQSIFVDYSNISFMCEPGRYLLAEAGCIKSQVVLRSDKLSEGSLSRWLYLDVGKFNGLYEATDIKHPIIYDPKHDAELVPTILSGPTCDSDDMLSLKNDYHKLPENINTGDFLIFASTGAYSNSYASVGFNGIPPLTEFYI